MGTELIDKHANELKCWLLVYRVGRKNSIRAASFPFLESGLEFLMLLVGFCFALLMVHNLTKNKITQE